jgi:Holliday junction resolvasome RuvABC endonuclease subunit
MEVLALDQATKCGWCTSTSSGTWNFTSKNNGVKLAKFKAKLIEITRKYGIEVIVYERVAGRFKNSIIHSAKMVGVIELFCEENGLKCEQYSASQIKKSATGKGNAKKPDMIKAAKEKYGRSVIDDNEADAIHLYHLALKDFA